MCTAAMSINPDGVWIIHVNYASEIKSVPLFVNTFHCTSLQILELNVKVNADFDYISSSRLLDVLHRSLRLTMVFEYCDQVNNYLCLSLSLF